MSCCAGLRSTLFDEPDAPQAKSELRTRWAMMLLLCLGLSSSYYAFDVPSATAVALQSAFLGAGAPVDNCVNGTNVPGADTGAADSFNNNFNLLYSLVIALFCFWMAG